MPFRRKLHTLLVLLVGVSCGLLLWMSLRKANRLAFGLIQEKVLSVVVSTAPRVDGDKVAQLTSPDQDLSPLYIEVRDKLREVRDANGEGALPIRFIYLIRPLDNGDWEYIVDAEEKGEERSSLGDLVEFQSELEKPPLDTARVDEAYARDSFGTWLSAFAPVTDSTGKTVAVLGADIESHRIEVLLKQLLIGDLIAMLISLCMATAVAAWLARKVTLPLTELRDFVKRIERGNLSSRLEVKSNDEFGELAQAINQMAEGLEERESLKGALVDYVRSQAADTKLKRTDDEQNVNREITVLVADLVGFNQLTSLLGSERVFALLNEYFSTMIDVILRHRGSLEKSSDESVIAVFGLNSEDSHQARHAVETALAMQQALNKLLKEWKIKTNKPILLEIGVSTSPLLCPVDQVDCDSVRLVIDQANTAKAVGLKNNNRLTVAESTAKKLQRAFPLEVVEKDPGSDDETFFRVDMPMLTNA
ncbi:adenylate/guanylate cyclase domain-containing protein [Verrucomicrobiales bacterium BCK34]|nr:adenylate/guanylate cyclase domain-containing protein [Verrucomicrobiales bacterium BCK34]